MTLRSILRFRFSIAHLVLLAGSSVAILTSAVERPAQAQQNAPSQASASEISPDVARLLAEIRARDSGQLAVSEEDGRFLRLLVATSGAKNALEIGGASGYSGIWIGLGLRETGGKLTTIEYDPVRARELAANIKRAGLADIVTVRAGDAFQEIPKVAGTFDFVFLDAWKRDYQRFFTMVFPRLQAGGLFIGHNVVNKKSELEDFLTTIRTHRSLLTTIVSPSGEGMSVSYRRAAN